MRAPRFAFSITSLSILTALVAVSVSRHLEVRRLKSEIWKAKHPFQVDNPSKVYVMPLESYEDYTWRFRVYIPPPPPQKRYWLRYSRRWQAAGFPAAASGGNVHLNGEQGIVSIYLRRDRGGWVFMREIEGMSGSGSGHGARRSGLDKNVRHIKRLESRRTSAGELHEQYDSSP